MNTHTATTDTGAQSVRLPVPREPRAALPPGRAKTASSPALFEGWAPEMSILFAGLSPPTPASTSSPSTSSCAGPTSSTPSAGSWSSRSDAGSARMAITTSSRSSSPRAMGTSKPRCATPMSSVVARRRGGMSSSLNRSGEEPLHQPPLDKREQDHDRQNGQNGPGGDHVPAQLEGVAELV